MTTPVVNKYAGTQVAIFIFNLSCWFVTLIQQSLGGEFEFEIEPGLVGVSLPWVDLFVFHHNI